MGLYETDKFAVAGGGLSKLFDVQIYRTNDLIWSAAPIAAILKFIEPLPAG
jgi:hypothetical protein